jgi:hypothetical protein
VAEGAEEEAEEVPMEGSAVRRAARLVLLLIFFDSIISIQPS